MLTPTQRQESYNVIKSGLAGLYELSSKAKNATPQQLRAIEAEQDAAMVQMVHHGLELAASFIEAVHVIAESAKRANPSAIDQPHYDGPLTDHSV